MKQVILNESSDILISAIIVNYQSGRYAAECIRSLLGQEPDRIEIIVVDNASTDDSIELLRTTFGNRIKLIESDENLGFGVANNLAASHAKGDFLLLVNPDAMLLGKDFCSTLTAFMLEHPDVGIVGPEIYEPSKQKYVLPKTKYPSERRLRNREILRRLPGQYAWILGACMLLRKSVFEQIEGFDPDFFLYGEDVDICLRIRKAGYQVGYCSSAKMTHVGGASESGTVPLDKFLRKKRGFFLFCKKHYEPADVVHIARMSLATTYFEALKIAMSRWLRLGNRQALLNRKQRLDATRIVIREVLGQTRDYSAPAERSFP